MKMFTVSYVSGFIAKRLLNNSDCDLNKNIWYLKCHHHLIPTQDSRSTAVQFSFLHVQLRIWWRLLVLLWLYWRLWCHWWLT